jgi:Holliday junction resolvase RusA-like endonuclease
MRFTLPLPPPLNACYGVTTSRQGRPYSYKRNPAKAWERDAQLLIYQQLGKLNPIESKVSLTVELYLVRDRDIDSSHKLLLDTLQSVNMIKNDKQIIELNTKKVYPAKEPRIVVELLNVGTTTP